MKFDLMKNYSERKFRREYYRQHPNGTEADFNYFYDMYKANRVTKKSPVRSKK